MHPWMDKDIKTQIIELEKDEVNGRRKTIAASDAKNIKKNQSTNSKETKGGDR